MGGRMILLRGDAVRGRWGLAARQEVWVSQFSAQNVPSPAFPTSPTAGDAGCRDLAAEAASLKVLCVRGRVSA